MRSHKRVLASTRRPWSTSPNDRVEVAVLVVQPVDKTLWTTCCFQQHCSNVKARCIAGYRRPMYLLCTLRSASQPSSQPRATPSQKDLPVISCRSAFLGVLSFTSSLAIPSKWSASDSPDSLTAIVRDREAPQALGVSGGLTAGVDQQRKLVDRVKNWRCRRSATYFRPIEYPWNRENRLPFPQSCYDGSTLKVVTELSQSPG